MEDQRIEPVSSQYKVPDVQNDDVERNQKWYTMTISNTGGRLRLSYLSIDYPKLRNMIDPKIDDEVILAFIFKNMLALKPGFGPLTMSIDDNYDVHLILDPGYDWEFDEFHPMTLKEPPKDERYFNARAISDQIRGRKRMIFGAIKQPGDEDKNIDHANFHVLFKPFPARADDPKAIELIIDPDIRNPGGHDFYDLDLDAVAAAFR